MWNTTADDVSLKMEIDLQALGLTVDEKARVISLSKDRLLPFLVQDNRIITSVDLSAHGIDMILINR
jgi:hypothetical protein